MKNLSLRYNPTQFISREAAFSWANNCIKLHMVVLGDNGKFWVVCFSDAQKLVRLGYELAK